MEIFLVWLLIISFFVTLYCFFLWKKRKGYKLQARVTILFLILTLAPSVPLTLFSIVLLNQSLDRLVSKELADTLNNTIESTRLLLNARSHQSYEIFMNDDIPSPTKIHLLNQCNVHEVIKIMPVGDEVSWEVLYVKENAQPLTELGIDGDEFKAIVWGELRNSLIPEENEVYFSYYQPVGESQVIAILLPLDEMVYKTINEVNKQLSSYGAIYLFKEGIIQGRLIWGLGVIFIIILAVVSVYVARKLSRGITEPIGELSGGFHKVAEGNLDVIVDVKAKDEVNILISSFNKMVLDLKETQKKLLQSERIAAWRDVARQISHEIKNPLTPIQLSIHRLRKKIQFNREDEPVVNECFRTISEEVESLRKLASEFSEFARLPKPKLKRGDINEVIRSAAALFETNEKDAEIRLNLSEDVPEFYFDAELMKRIFINLITNSLDALENDNDIITIEDSIIREDTGDEQVMIRIIDCGVGMTEDTLRSVYKPYFTTKKEGSGLGLPVIKRIMDEHKGEISIESEPGKGTTVTLLLRPALIEQEIQNETK